MESQKANKIEQSSAPEKELKVKEFEIQNPVEAIEEVVVELDEYGGFDLYNILDDNFGNMDPGAAAAKDVYLSESEWKADRKNLIENVNIFIEILSQEGTITNLIESCETEAKKNEDWFNSN